MIGEVSPGLILIVGALLVPLLRGPLRAAYLLALPLAALWVLIDLPYGTHGQFHALDLTLTTLRVDKLSFLFGLIFLIATFLGLVFALHEDDPVQHVAALIYAGSAIGAVFAGDLMTLFVFWEGTAVASVFLIWASRTEAAYRSGLRYLVVQVGSGVLLLTGAILHYRATGSLAFELFNIDTPAAKLILLSFGIKCAFPLLHAWLQDSYPQATVSGTVILSAFTTKLAAYALARGFAGTELLVPIGAAMALFPMLYAVIENDLRRVLCYSLIVQLGFMVVGIGIGSEMALNGAVAHAFVHILYKALLFMSVGAVLYRAGTAGASDLGGLARAMPWTAGFCIVGAGSISAVPLFAGFVSKALILQAALDGGYFWTWIALLVASAGVLQYVGLKVPYCAFFAPSTGRRATEAPANMLVAMGLAAALCMLIGVYPQPLYALLPYAVDYTLYTVEHVVTQLQLLLFSAFVFVALMRTGIYPSQRPATNLDVDWFYRRPGTAVAVAVGRSAAAAWYAFATGATGVLGTVRDAIIRYHGPEGVMARPWPTGTMTFWTTAMLAAYLVLSYL